VASTLTITPPIRLLTNAKSITNDSHMYVTESVHLYAAVYRIIN
jgi:hypothetical protein